MAREFIRVMRAVEPVLTSACSMVALATLCQTIFHPGFCFPNLSASFKQSDIDEKRGLELDEGSEERSEHFVI